MQILEKLSRSFNVTSSRVCTIRGLRAWNTPDVAHGARWPCDTTWCYPRAVCIMAKCTWATVKKQQRHQRGRGKKPRRGRDGWHKVNKWKMGKMWKGKRKRWSRGRQMRSDEGPRMKGRHEKLQASEVVQWEVGWWKMGVENWCGSGEMDGKTLFTPVVGSE